MFTLTLSHVSPESMKYLLRDKSTSASRSIVHHAYYKKQKLTAVEFSCICNPKIPHKFGMCYVLHQFVSSLEAICRIVEISD